MVTKDYFKHHFKSQVSHIHRGIEVGLSEVLRCYVIPIELKKGDSDFVFERATVRRGGRVVLGQQIWNSTMFELIYIETPKKIEFHQNPMTT